MENRVRELRRRSRRVFWLSMLAAVGVHLALLLVFLRPESDLPADTPIEHDVDGTLKILRFVNVHFGPPEIFAADGTTRKEPPDRVLVTRNFDLLEAHLPEACRAGPHQGLVPATARLRLEVNQAGRIEAAGIAEGTGSACADGMMTAIAETLWYRWLPSATFPAPVDLIQPMSIEDAAN